MEITDWIMIIFCAIAVVLEVLIFCHWYSRSQGISYKAALLVLWKGAVVDGFQDFFIALLLGVKSAAKMLWCCVKVLVPYLYPPPPRYAYTPALFYGLYGAIKEYIYSPFQPVIDVDYFSKPSYIYVALYTKSAITTETAAEITTHIQAKYEAYLTYYGLGFKYMAFPYVQGNLIEVYIYYCENAEEYPAYQEHCQRVMAMITPPAFRSLLESDIPQTRGIVLGYQYEPWQTVGRAVPIVWDMAKAPHLMVSGPTGGGKTVFVKCVLEQLLKDGVAVTICDYKGYGDLRGFGDAYAAGTDCDALLADFCTGFEQAREQAVLNGQKQVLIFDEFATFAASKEKKEFDALMRQISNLIFMGRSYGYHVILVGQRFDADTIRTNLRDQFGIKVYMGQSISQQAATMLFPGSEVDKSERLPPYCGYIATPKTDCTVIITPKVDLSALDSRLKALSHK